MCQYCMRLRTYSEPKAEEWMCPDWQPSQFTGSSPWAWVQQLLLSGGMGCLVIGGGERVMSSELSLWNQKMETPVQCSRVLIWLQLPKNVQPRLLLDAELCIVEVSGGTATFLPIHLYLLCLKHRVTSCSFGSGRGIVRTQIMFMEIPFQLTCLFTSFLLVFLSLIFLPHLLLLNISNHPLIHLFTQPTFFRRLLCSRYCDRC